MTFIVDFFTDYGFIIEMIAAIAILVWKQERKNKFLLRVTASILTLFLFAYLWDLLIDQTVISVIFRHTIISFMAMFGIVFSFRSGIWSSIFLVTIAWTIQHIAFEVGFFLRAYMDQITDPMYGIVLYILVAILVYSIAFILIGNKLKDEESLPLASSNKEIVLAVATLIIFASIFKNVFDFLIDRNNFFLLLAITSYDLISCFLVLFILFGILGKSRLERETTVLEHVLNMQNDQLASSKKNIDIMNVKYHDLKYLIASLDDKISNEELESLNNVISAYALYLKTGNEALDVILAEKRLQCEELNIKVNCIADGDKLNYIPAAEVYSLFGNAIDNAINAVQSVKQEERRVINISVKESMNMVSIVFENDFVGELKFEDELPVTTRENKMFHGFGMKSIKMIVDKYNGYMSVKVDNNRFVLSILLDQK